MHIAIFNLHRATFWIMHRAGWNWFSCCIFRSLLTDRSWDFCLVFFALSQSFSLLDFNYTRVKFSKVYVCVCVFVCTAFKCTLHRCLSSLRTVIKLWQLRFSHTNTQTNIRSPVLCSLHMSLLKSDTTFFLKFYF